MSAHVFRQRVEVKSLKGGEAVVSAGGKPLRVGAFVEYTTPLKNDLATEKKKSCTHSPKSPRSTMLDEGLAEFIERTQRLPQEKRAERVTAPTRDLLLGRSLSTCSSVSDISWSSGEEDEPGNHTFRRNRGSVDQHQLHHHQVYQDHNWTPTAPGRGIDRGPKDDSSRSSLDRMYRSVNKARRGSVTQTNVSVTANNKNATRQDNKPRVPHRSSSGSRRAARASDSPVGRTTPRPPQRSPSPAPPSPSASSAMIEIAPGHMERLRGAKEAFYAVKHDFFLPTVCAGCETSLCCVMDAKYVICPTCRVVGPLGQDDQDDAGKSGVGLGFTMEVLFQWQQEIREGTR